MYKPTEQLAEVNQGLEPAQAAGDNVVPFPRHADGVFYSPEAGPTLPYPMEITDWEPMDVKHKKGVGEVETTLVSFSDRSKFVFRTTAAENPMSPVMVDITPPLMTHVNGFNTRLAEMMAKSDISSRIVGTNQARGFSLLHDAEAALLILQRDDTERAKQHGFNPNQSVKTGYSKGIMEGLGELVIARGIGRDIKATLGLDPCMAQKIDYEQEAKEALAVVLYLAREGLEAVNMVGGELIRGRPDKAIKKLHQGVVTFMPTPKHLLNQKDKWDTLASGETGTFPSLIPEESVIVLHFFGGSRYGQAAVFEDKFKDHPYFRSIHEGGYHLTGGKDSVLENVVIKTGRTLELIEQGASKSDLADALCEPVLQKAA